MDVLNKQKRNGYKWVHSSFGESSEYGYQYNGQFGSPKIKSKKENHQKYSGNVSRICEILGIVLRYSYTESWVANTLKLNVD